MDHSQIDHSQMDHSMHDMPGMCQMSMLFTTEYKDLCILTSKWHVHSKGGLFLSMVGIVFICMLYEFWKTKVSSWEAQQSRFLQPHDATDSTESLHSQYYSKHLRRTQVIRSLLYGVTVSYSFIIMLIFMSFNFWAMLSVALGAVVGNYIWAGPIPGSMACH